MNVGHAERGEHRQIHDADAAAEIAAVDGDEQFEDGSSGHRRGGGVMRDAGRNSPGQVLAESEQQRGAKHEPRQHVQESLRGRLDQEQCSGQATENTGEHQGNHHAPRNVELLGVGAAARGGSYPEGESVGGVGGDRWNAGKQKRGEGDKTPSAGNCINGASQSSGEKEKDGSVEVQTSLLSRLTVDAPAGGAFRSWRHAVTVSAD